MSIVNNRLLSSALHTTHRLARWEGNMRLASTRRTVACRCPTSPPCQRWTRCPPAEVEQLDRRCHEAEIGESSTSLSVTTGGVQDLDWAPADSLAPRTVIISIGLELWICVHGAALADARGNRTVLYRKGTSTASEYVSQLPICSHDSMCSVAVNLCATPTSVEHLSTSACASLWSLS